MAQHLKIGFLVSRNGSSLRAIVEAIGAGDLAAQPRLVVSNNKSAPALAFAADQGIATLCIPTQADPQAADLRLRDAMSAAEVDLIVLSGYLRRLGPLTLERFAGRVLNIHPGPLPAFGGDGMYGARVHQAVIDAGASHSAATIHLVDEEYDHGAVIAARQIPLQPGDTAQSLEARVTGAEPSFFVEILKRIATGDLALPKP